MTPELERLAQLYTYCRTEVDAGRMTYDQALAEFAKYNAVDVLGNQWWVDPKSSSLERVQFVVRDRSGATNVMGGDRWPGSPPTSAVPLPTNTVETHHGYGPSNAGSVERPLIADNLPDVDLGEEDDDDGIALTDRVQAVLDKFPGGKIAAGGVAFVAIAVLVFLVGGFGGGGDTATTDEPETVAPVSGWIVDTCFDGIGFSEAAPANAGSPVSCDSAHAFELLTTQTPSFSGVAVELCATQVVSLGGDSGLSVTAASGVWSSRDEGVLYCLVSFRDVDGALATVSGSILNQ